MKFLKFQEIPHQVLLFSGNPEKCWSIMVDHQKCLEVQTKHFLVILRFKICQQPAIWLHTDLNYLLHISHGRSQILTNNKSICDLSWLILLFSCQLPAKHFDKAVHLMFLWEARLAISTVRIAVRIAVRIPQLGSRSQDFNFPNVSQVDLN